jgi:hypothetical protein
VAIITAIFGIALGSLGRELRYIRALTDYLGSDLAPGDPAATRSAKPARGAQANLETDGIRDEARAILSATDAAWAQKQVRGWQMRVQRIEPALAFWVDFLRQLGLLFTVVGLGLALTVDRGSVGQLLQPLSLAVWTTVAGLFYSIWLSAQYGIKLTAWADACEKNLEAWDSRRPPPGGAVAP